MIDPSLFAAFVAAVTVLMLIPGPNVSLIIANSVAYGPRYGLLTVAGTCTAMVGQLGLTALGMNEALGVMGNLFAWLRWIGVIYLVWLGVRQWRAPPIDLTQTRAEPRSSRAIFTRALLVSATNPKTLLFYGAFLPQFITGGEHAGLTLGILCGTIVAIAVTVDSGWALLAGRLRFLLASRGRVRNRLSGGCLIGAGAALALARRR